MKNRIVAALIVLLWPSPVLAAWAHVQTATQTAATSSIARAFASNVTAGSLLVDAITWQCNSGQTISSVVGSSSGAHAQAGSTVTQTGAGGNWCIAVYYVANAAGGADTITVTFSGSGAEQNLSISEYSGIATSSALDQTAGNPQTDPTGGTDLVTSGNVTTGANNELIFGATLVLPQDGGVAGTGFTLRGHPQQAFSELMTEDKNLASAGVTAATFTIPYFSTNDTATIVATFKEPSAAGTPCQLLLLGAGKCG